MPNVVTDIEIKEILNDALMTKIINKNLIFGVFTYDKVNYGFAKDEKDVKIYLYYIPSIDDICFQKNINDINNLKVDNITFIDIRKILMYYQENKNIFESLFSNYYLINSKYEEIYNKYFKKEKITSGKKVGKDWIIKDGYFITLTNIRKGILELVENSIVINPIKTNNVEEKFTKTEEKALNVILNELGEKREGNISISNLIEKSKISRPVFKNTLLKLEKNELAKIDNQGTKGTYVRFY